MAEGIAFVFLSAAFWYDMRLRIIPNWLNLTGLIAGIALQVFAHGLEGGKASLIGMFVGFGATLSLYFLKAVGAGDVKCFAALGALLGPTLVIDSLIYSTLIAAVIAILYWMFRNEWGNKVRTLIGAVLSFHWHRNWKTFEVLAKSPTTIPFMIAVFPGTCWAALISIHG